MSIDVKHLLKDHAYQNVPLTYEEAFELGRYALTGCQGDTLAQIQSVAALSSLHNRATYNWTWDRRAEEHHGHGLPRSAAEQIAGICAAVIALDMKESEFGFLQPKVEYAMDNCGMGGDLVVTANISTLAAFIASTAGIPMCKHGSPANADKGLYGSSDFLSHICGINVFADRQRVEACIEQLSFGFTEATDTRYKQIHVQTHQVAKLPHMNDIIGPITNPLSAQVHSRRVLGVNQLIVPRLIAEAYCILNERGLTNMRHGLFIRGFVDETRTYGMDEVSICRGGTQVAELRDGEIEEYDLHAHDFGVAPCSIESVRPIGNKGEYSMKLLRGEINGERRQVILANAALLFYLAGKAKTMQHGMQLSTEVFDGGNVYDHVQKIRNFLA